MRRTGLVLLAALALGSAPARVDLSARALTIVARGGDEVAIPLATLAGAQVMLDSNSRRHVLTLKKKDGGYLELAAVEVEFAANGERSLPVDRLTISAIELREVELEPEAEPEAKAAAKETPPASQPESPSGEQAAAEGSAS